MIDHLDDLDADFRRFYGIAGVGEEEFPPGLSGPRFLALAWRLGAYEGVISALSARQRGGERQQAGVGVRVPKGDVEWVEATPTNLRAHSALAGVIDT